MVGPSEAHDGWAVCDNAILTPPQYRGIAGDATAVAATKALVAPEEAAEPQRKVDPDGLLSEEPKGFPGPFGSFC